MLLQRRAVCVLPYDPIADRVVLVEQFRAGCVDDPGRPWLVEAVAGLMEQGESPEDVARREIFEECGLECRRLDRAGAYRSSPGCTSEMVESFVGEVTAPEAEGVFGHEGEDEDIRAFAVPAAEAYGWIADGRITAANTIVPLQHLMLHRDRLRRDWATP